MYNQPKGMFSGDDQYDYNWNREFIQNDFESLKPKETVSELPVLGMKKEDESLQDSGQHRVGDNVLKTESQRECVSVSQSPEESTPDLENKTIKIDKTASPSARTRKKLSKHTCAGKIHIFLYALLCFVRSMI